MNKKFLVAYSTKSGSTGEVAKYMSTLHELMDVSIVIELNILRDWIKVGDKAGLKERLDTLQSLDLRYSVERLRTLLSPTV